MGFAKRWLETFRSVLTRPREYFEGESDGNGYGYALEFAAVSLVLTGFLNLGATVLLRAQNGFNSVPVDLGLILFKTMLADLSIILLMFLFFHLGVRLFGGQGFRRTLAVIGYSTAVLPVMAAVSYLVLGGSVAIMMAGFGIFLLILHLFYIQFHGLQSFHGFSPEKAALSILLPMAIFMVIFIATVLGLMSSTSGILLT